MDYKTIAAAGGGILESVRDVRARSESELAALTRARLGALLAHGATTIEVKSGYGLDCETELRQLRVIARLTGAQPAALVPTFLGAHEVPPEFRDRRADYVRLVCEEMIPAVAGERLAVACDVFCEPGVFSDAGAALALATDLNPGSSPTLSLPLVMALGVSQLGLRHAEAVNAVTVNAAAALGMVADRGQLAPGFRADLTVCDVADWREVAYW